MANRTPAKLDIAADETLIDIGDIESRRRNYRVYLRAAETVYLCASHCGSG